MGLFCAINKSSTVATEDARGIICPTPKILLLLYQYIDTENTSEIASYVNPGIDLNYQEINSMLFTFVELIRMNCQPKCDIIRRVLNI